MKYVDANIILRYVLWDIESLSKKAQKIIESENIIIPIEVIAEVVYVLEGVYTIHRAEIKDAIMYLTEYENIEISTDILKQAFSIFVDKKIDFVDAVLYGYSKIQNAVVFTFDKKLENLIKTYGSN